MSKHQRAAVVSAYKARRKIARELYNKRVNLREHADKSLELEEQRALGAVFALGALLGLNEFVVHGDVMDDSDDIPAPFSAAEGKWAPFGPS